MSNSTDEPVPRAQIVAEVLAGQEKLVSHDGASQYVGGGIASCGLAALNFVRIILGRVTGGIQDGALLEDILSRWTTEEVISICSQWSSNVHLEVEDIFKVPLFERALTLISPTYGEPGFERFRALLSDLQEIPDDYAAVVITRPPEIITCLKFPIGADGSKQSVFVIFDSHPRNEHPNGAGLIVNTSLDATAIHLARILAVDSRLLADSSLQWQTQLLAQFSGHFIVGKASAANSVEELTQAVLESSLAVLSSHAEVADLKFQTSSLVRERQALEMELEDLKEKYRSIKKKLDANPRSCPQCNQHSSPTSKKPSTRHPQPQPQAISGPSKFPNSMSSSSSPTTALEYFSSAAKKPSTRHPQPQPQAISGPSKFPNSMSSSSSPPTALEYFSSAANIKRPRPNSEFAADYLLATQLQKEHDQARHHSTSAIPEDDPMDDYIFAANLQMDWDKTQRSGALSAAAKQREFEDEDRRLLAERAALQAQAQVVFDCGICFDKYPEDVVARVSGCAHGFCRDCLRGYVVSKLTDKLFPIFCPMCVANNTCVEPSPITDDLVQTLGLDDKQYQVLQELQITALSILLHCRKCKDSVYVDRMEYEAAPIIVCPFPRCTHAWCKACQQTIDVGGPKHSCDGSSELEDLMRRRGWKHCPGCKAAIQKESGCNHMTCLSPGCSTHFCYVCGESIVRSALAREIKTAVSDHYRRCSLFEDVATR